MQNYNFTSFFFCECETWSLTFREEHILRVFENRMLRRILGPKGKKVVGGGRRLHNEELYKLYASLDVIKVIKSRRMRCTGHVAGMGNMRNVYKILFAKPEGKRPPRRPRRIWKEVSGLAAWSENCSLPLDAIVSLFCEST
jgi:hypothetical protein